LLAIMYDMYFFFMKNKYFIIKYWM
jgi:hypothetical protein